MLRLLGRALLWGWTALLFLYCFDATYFFSYHVTLAALSYVVLMGEAVLMLTYTPSSADSLLNSSCSGSTSTSPSSSLSSSAVCDGIEQSLSRRQRKSVHAYLQLVAFLLAVASFYVVVQNKFNLGKHHFKSWHSWFGLLAFVCLLLNVATGAASFWLHSFLRNKLGLSAGSIAAFLRWHRNFAKVMWGLAILAILVGLQTSYMGKQGATSSMVLLLSLLLAAAWLLVSYFSGHPSSSPLRWGYQAPTSSCSPASSPSLDAVSSPLK
ncbi:hypothetical protein QOT17_009163 [Balamuthia mandrillaris]